MQGLLHTPPWALSQPWLDISSPPKSPGARQRRALNDLHRCQVAHQTYSYQQDCDPLVPPPVNTVHAEKSIGIGGLHSFKSHNDDQSELNNISPAGQLSEGIQSTHFSTSLNKHVPCQHPTRSAPLPLWTPHHRPHQRSLTSKQDIFNYEMTTATAAPNSPPSLSESKSSKSSSSQSSTFDGPEGITNDVSNFEEIGLDGDARTSCGESGGWDHNGFAKRLNSRVPLIPPRDLATTRDKSTSPSLQSQAHYTSPNTVPNSADLHGSDGAPGAAMKRVFTAPSIVPVPMLLSGAQPRTRSSSPSPKLPASASFASTGHNVRFGPRSRYAAIPSRRGSWQPFRKTIVELEAEYHDSDDELEDDTSLWNVPVSPRPPTAHPSSARSSNRGSPERDGSIDRPRPLPLSHAVPIAEPSAPHRMSHPLLQNRPPPRTSSLQRAASTTNLSISSEPCGLFPNTGPKSWSLAMSELSEEARVLTETLRFHAASKDRTHEQNIQNGTKSHRSSVESYARRSVSSSAIELPPIQKGNILIDPMPLSKEKEAVLTRTRPSWLPPKNPKEEKRHLKEYQRMMAASLDAEKRREDLVKVRQCEKDNTREALNRIWEQYVYPDWDRVTHEHRTRELWWRGVSPRLRGQVWMRAVGNPLGLTEISYARALQRVKDLRARSADELGEKECSMRAWYSDIESDAKFAFPELNVFHKEGPMWQELVDVCCAYVSYRSDVGYMYGIHLIAALMLLQLPAPADVFILLANCLNRPLALAFLTNDSSSTTKALQHASSTLLYKFPRLHQYLFGPLHDSGLAMHPAEIFEPIFRTLLTNGLDIERLVRVWDCFVFEGDGIITRAAIALLGCLQPQIFGSEGSVQEKRKAIQDLLAWGPTGRVHGYWHMRGDADLFMADVKEAGKINSGEQ